MLMLLSLLLFIIFGFLFFTLPGALLLDRSKIDFSFWERLILSTALGLVIFTLLGYLFLVLNAQILILPVLTILVILSVLNLRKRKIEIKFLPKKLLIPLLVFLIIGVLGQLLVIAPSGITYNGDILFWSSHAHDSAWHIALMNQMQKGFPIQNPAFSGERLLNYHFFSDIAPSYFNYLLKFSPLDLYFRFFPLIYAFLFASLAFLLGKRLTNNFWGGFWSMIMADFCGGAGFILTLARSHTLGGESIFWSSQPQSTIGNPPQVTACILFLAFLYLFALFLEKKSKAIFFSLLLIGGSLIVFKVYAGIALLGSLGLVGVWQTLRERKWDILALFFSGSVLSALLYLPNTANSASFLIFQPWWYIRTMVVSSDKLDQLDWELKRQTYLSEGNWKRIIQLETQAFLIFLFGNLWLRAAAFLALPKILKTILSNYLNQMLLSIILISFIFPMLFLQKGVASNTSQFFQYFLLLMGILAAVGIAQLAKKIKSSTLKIILGGLIIILCIPTQLGLLMDFYSRPAFTKIDATELSALNYLAQKTPENAVILNPPFNRYLNLHEQTPQIWGWSDTNYIGAFGNRVTYLSDQEQVDIMGYDYHGRKDLEDRIFAEKDPLTFTEMVDQTGADYLYIPKSQLPPVDISLTPFTKVFDNQEIEVWKVR